MIIKTESGLAIQGKRQFSILDSALEAGFVFEYSCKNGRCGICKTRLLEGRVEELQPQIALEGQAADSGDILACCCAPVTDVLIDAEDLTVLKDIKIKTLPVRISRINHLSANIVQVYLRFPPSVNFKFLEGQYIDVIWNGIRRSYSIASSASEAEILLLIKKVDQGVMSEYWFNSAKNNDLLRIEGPKGTFFLRDKTKSLVFMATGTGIAPIKAILEKLDEDEAYVQSENIYLFWGNRYQDDLVWKPNFKNLNVTIKYVVSRPGPEWIGSTGYVQDVVLDKIGQPLKHGDVYACGSNEMIHSAQQVFDKKESSENQFYSDAFVQSY